MNFVPLLRNVQQSISSLALRNSMKESVRNVTERTFHSVHTRQNISSTPTIFRSKIESIFLQPVSIMYNMVCGMKVKGVLKRRCKDCYRVVRQERAYIMCKKHPRHKQMEMRARPYKSWILTSVSQTKVRPW